MLTTADQERLWRGIGEPQRIPLGAVVYWLEDDCRAVAEGIVFGRSLIDSSKARIARTEDPERHTLRDERDLYRTREAAEARRREIEEARMGRRLARAARKARIMVMRAEDGPRGLRIVPVPTI